MKSEAAARSGAEPSADAGREPVQAGIRCRGLRKSFGPAEALAGIDFTIPRLGRASIVGASGCGKSTLLLIIAGLLEQDAGLITIDEASLPSDRLARCALMPQRDLLLPWRTALDNAAIALENKGVSRRQARERTRPLFQSFGLAGFEDALPEQLSGGMRQRVSFLRTYMAEKDVLLLDEPFGALDSITRAHMQEWLLATMERLPRTLVLVTHDLEEALLLGDLVVVLSRRPGRIRTILEPDLRCGRSRSEIVADPLFIRLKQQGLEAIG